MSDRASKGIYEDIPGKAIVATLNEYIKGSWEKEYSVIPDEQHLIEQAMAALAKGLVAAGVRRLVVAGGETSGAVVTALGVEGLEIGEQIAPGVPATLSIGPLKIAFALKSGNFGGPDFFAEALRMLK